MFMIEEIMVEEFMVEEFMVEEFMVEEFMVKALGWKSQGSNVLQPNNQTVWGSNPVSNLET